MIENVCFPSPLFDKEDEKNEKIENVISLNLLLYPYYIRNNCN